MTSPEPVNLAAIQAALGEQGHPWQAADNPLTRMSPQERRRRLGVPLPDEAERAAIQERQARATRRQPNLELDFSEAHLFYTHGATQGVTCDTGWLPQRALEMCRDIGITFEDYFPYTPGNSGGAVLNADWPNRLARAVEVSTVTGDPVKIKEQISTYGAVTGCFVVYTDFFSYRSGVYRHVSGNVEGGHCVALIGYDDAQGCWIAKNSWGPSWGDQGFVR